MGFLISIFNAVFRPQKSTLRRKWKRQSNESLVVEYDLADGDQRHYPQLLTPQRDTPIVMPQRGKNCKRGPGELWLAVCIKLFGIKGFYDNLALSTGGHRYEPDLAYIDEARGIFIDIENDEPHTMGRRIPTHIIGSDDQRNGLITDAGWIVLRFSERQCITSPRRVVRTIMDVVRSIDPSVEMPKALRKRQPVIPEERWDQSMARSYASSRVRDTYLEKHLPLYCIFNKFYK